MGRLSKGIKSIIAIVAIIGIIIRIFIFISLKNRPDSSDILTYMEQAYKKDFQIINEFTYIAHTDGEVEAQRELKCPVVELQDKENSVLDNTDETAQKLQNMVIRFNELYQYDDQYVSGRESFDVEGSTFGYSIEAGNISDRWLDETGPFCYDTPIEKYETFLNELEENLEETDEVSETPSFFRLLPE